MALAQPDPHELVRLILEIETVRSELVSAIWIGSLSRAADVHERSDLDIQLVLKDSATAPVIALADVLSSYPDVDLSLVYLSDIFDPEGEIDFQDGTKGPFFIHVLANGVLLHGENVYAEAALKLDLRDVQPSLMFTMREYLCRLRVLVVQDVESTQLFKKYTTKLLRDVLAYTGVIALHEMPSLSSSEVLTAAANTFQLLPRGVLINELQSVSEPMEFSSKAATLLACEKIVERLRREHI